MGVDLTELLLEDGLSVVMAINSIDYTSYIDDMSSYAVIGGNQNKTIN